VVKAIKVAGSEAVLVYANVVSGPDIKKIIAAAITLSLDGKIDMLVHNAGHRDDCFLEHITEELCTIQSDINLKGAGLSQNKSFVQ